MKPFPDDNFLLKNETAVNLYHTIAKDLPIVDYHNHLNPQQLAINKKFDDLAALWITEDPYKHRAMRINGIPEAGITGNATGKEKYLNWVKTFPKTMGNPLYHWTSLELKRVFDIDEPLSEKNAERIWSTCNSLLAGNSFGAMDILLKFKTETVCTSDDLLDNLEAHQQATKKNIGITVLPTLRADSIIAFNNPSYAAWLNKLEAEVAFPITSLEDYQNAIIQKLDTFNNAGCRLADVSLDAGFSFIPTAKANASVIFDEFLRSGSVSDHELVSLKSYLLFFLGAEYQLRNWVMQLHIGAQRFTSSRLRMLAGPAGGYATIGKACDINSLCLLLDTLEKEDCLPKTILFTLNPADNAAFATLTGSFSADGVPGKIQFGPAWWYNDQYEGIRQHLLSLSSYGLLSRFVGMTTDSRSILSFSRHEYFRRILCNMVGTWVTEGELPNDEELIGQLIKDISYNNSLHFIFNK